MVDILILEDMNVDPEEIDVVPEASYATNKKYFRGTLSYQQEMVSILDIVKILRNDDLIVDRSG